jgi:hypothetical protein
VVDAGSLAAIGVPDPTGERRSQIGGAPSGGRRAIWFNRIGKAMGESMLELVKNQK